MAAAPLFAGRPWPIGLLRDWRRVSRLGGDAKARVRRSGSLGGWGREARRTMIGLDGRRVYLDWNATAPLRSEARAAMLEAMDVVGNPSSVHAEGRAARVIVERARGQVAHLVGCEPDEIVFTSGATEAAALWFYAIDSTVGTEIEHDAVWRQLEGNAFNSYLDVDRDGVLQAPTGLDAPVSALQAANSETGVVQALVGKGDIGFCDATQAVGRSCWRFATSLARAGTVSAHKIGGPSGVGALMIVAGEEPFSPLHAAYGGSGGGQEHGRRSGTENIIGIAGFGAAAEAAQRDLEAGVWDRVENLRIILENSLADIAPDLIVIGQGAERLPNTSCVAVLGWKGETQVMQMDLAGFAISAGSACSSGKVRESRVLRAMGYDAETASSAVRVSMGPTTTEAEVRAFAAAWGAAYAKRRVRAER